MAETKKKAVAAAKPKAAAKSKTAAKAKAEVKPKAEVKGAPKPEVKAAVKPKVARVKKAKVEGASTAPARETNRKLRSGLVVSNKMEKTVVVLIQRRTQHPIYGKVVIRSNKFKVHDEQGCDIGDLVEIMETRPISKDKRWRVTQILEKVK
jgi:small subunit ribosomal protein S17